MPNGTPNILNSNGSLQVSAYIVDIGKPLSGVAVRVPPPHDNRQNILRSCLPILRASRRLSICRRRLLIFP